MQHRVAMGHVGWALAKSMDAPHIVFGFRPTVLVGLFLAMARCGCSGRSLSRGSCGGVEGGFSNL